MTRSPLRATTHRPIRSPGKSTFLMFMLARLLSLRQVVLLCDNLVVYLFYRGKVYTRSAEIGPGNLPTKDSGYCPVWGLIDVDYMNEEPSSSITSNSNVWPIQASLPDPLRWRSWRTQNNAASLTLDMPLWKKEPVNEW